MTIGGHRETHRVRGRAFREWLRHQYFQQTGSACNSDALREAVETIAAKAQYTAPEHNVYVRIAERRCDLHRSQRPGLAGGADHAVRLEHYS